MCIRDRLYGINQLKTDAQILGYDDRGRLTATDVKLTLIPYYAWAHRGAGAMAVSYTHLDVYKRQDFG